MTNDTRRPLAGHLPALDGVRGLALLAVLAFHFIGHGPGYQAWPTWLRAIALSGWAGVDLFFVLSGFLITRILLASRGRPGAMRVFYVRRALRIFPLYNAILLAATVGVLVVGRGRLINGELKNLAALWLYVTNFNVAANGFEVAILRQVQFTHLWTLAIEEQFYLAWPILMLFLRRRLLAPVCVAIVVASPLIRTQSLDSGTGPIAVYVATACRVDSLAWGALVAVLATGLSVTALRRFGFAMLAVGLVTVAGILAVTRSPDEYAYATQTLGYTALAAAAAGWIATLQTRSRSAHPLLTQPWLMAVGRYSYAAYLFHIPLRGVASFVWRNLLNTDPATLSLPQSALTTAMLTAATLAAAAASFEWFESRWLRMKPALPPG